MLQDELPQTKGRFKPVFSEETEMELKQYCTDVDNYFFGLTLKDVRGLAFDLAERNNLTHPFDTASRLAGKDWAYGFLKRCGLSLRQPEPTSIGRAMGFNRVQVDLFYSLLRSQIETHHFTPGQIYNMDESGMSTVPSRLPKVVAAVGKRAINKIVSGERGQTITAVCCFSASGVYVPPALIFPRRRLRDELMDGAPAGSLGLVSDSGFINQELFIEYLEHFRKSVRPSPSSPVLLILDNHSSHVSVGAIDFCRKNDIHMLSIPPHGSHKIQPLDVVFFGPLKVLYSAECDTWQVSNPGRAISQYQVARIFRGAYEKAATVEKATKGFQCTGIWPFDPAVFSEVDFLPSMVTEVEMPSVTVDNEEESDPPPSLSAQLGLSDMNIDSTASLAPLQQMPEPTTPSVKPVTETCQKVTPEMIRPMPRCTTRRPGVRKAQKATLITGSPFKLFRTEVEDRRNKVKRRPTGKGKANLGEAKAKYRSISQTKKVVSRKIFEEAASDVESCVDEAAFCDDDSDDELLDTLNPQPSQRSSFRKRRAPEGNEHSGNDGKKNSSEMCKRSLTSSSDSGDNCVLCGEFGKGGEVWFRCIMCSYWAHKACTGRDKPDNYICDHCE